MEKPQSTSAEDGRVAAVHIVESTAFDVPCYCMLYNTEEEYITRINVKHQDPNNRRAKWELQFSVTPSQWEGMELGGLVFEVKQDRVEILTESGPLDTAIAVAIEVGKYIS